MDSITTPRGSITIAKNHQAKLQWNPDFAGQRTEQFSRMQKFIDSEVLRLSTPYIPIKTGMLIKSGILGTVVGSGEVNYIAPYADAQYRTAVTRSYDAQRGGLWFERMKIDHKKEILEGAKKAGGIR